MDVPNVKRTEYSLVSHSLIRSLPNINHTPQLNIDDGFLNLLDDNGVQKNDVPVPETEVGQEIQAAFEKSEGGDIRVTIVSAMKEEQAISFKEVAGEK